MNDSGESRPHDVHPLYQRLLGGVVLLALAAIIIPAVFDLSHDPGRTIKETNIPLQPEGMKVEVLPLPAAEPIVVPRADIEANIAAQRPKFTTIDGRKGPVTLPKAPAAVKAASSVRTVDPVSQKSVPATSVLPKSSSQSDAAWVVQVGSFGREANARALLARIQKAGFPALIYTDALASGKSISRVWVGPVTSNEKAEGMRRNLLSKMKLKGLVLHRSNASEAR